MPEKQIVREIMANTLILDLPDEVVRESLLTRPITETIAEIAIEKHADAPYDQEEYREALEYASNLLKDWIENCPDEFDTDVVPDIVRQETRRIVASIRDWAETPPPDAAGCL